MTRPCSGYSIGVWGANLQLASVSGYDDGEDRWLTWSGTDERRPLTEYEFALAVGMLMVAHRVVQNRQANELDRDFFEPFRTHENRFLLAMMGREE